MFIISAKLTYHIPQSVSLKDKRQVRRSIIEKTRKRFNVSIAEGDTQDKLQILTIGIVVVSGDAAHANNSIDEITRYMETHSEAELIGVETDI